MDVQTQLTYMITKQANVGLHEDIRYFVWYFTSGIYITNMYITSTNDFVTSSQVIGWFWPETTRPIVPFQSKQQRFLYALFNDITPLFPFHLQLPSVYNLLSHAENAGLTSSRFSSFSEQLNLENRMDSLSHTADVKGGNPWLDHHLLSQ